MQCTDFFVSCFKKLKILRSIFVHIFAPNKQLIVGSKKWSLPVSSFQILVCADGAPSKLATQLGIVSRPPDSTCSRAYVEAGTHKFKADGVVFYNKDLLPGLFCRQDIG